MHKRLTVVVSVLAVLAGVGNPTEAQQPEPAPTPKPPAFATYVPTSAKFFLAVNKPKETDAALRRANAWPFLTLLVGGDSHHSTSPGLSNAMSAFFGPESTINVDDLLQGELGFAINSWSELGGAVWLVSPPDETTLNRWFPQQARPSGVASRPVRSLRAPDGLRGVISREALVLGRRVGKNSLLRHCALLLVGRKKDALIHAPNFRELTTYLPANALATAYFAHGKNDSIRAQPALSLPTLQNTVVGLYERQGRFDIVIHGTRSESDDAISVSLDVFGRLVRLPQTTMLAVATTIHNDRLRTILRSVLRRFLPEVPGGDEATAATESLFDQFNPHVIVAVEQNVVDAGSSVQLAFLIRCTRTRTLITKIDRIVGGVLPLLDGIDPIDEQSKLIIHRESHLGVPIHFIPLKAYAEASRFPSMALFQKLEPAWAVWGNWLILALDREHIKRIVDAQFGLAPTLTVLPEIKNMNYYRAERSTFAIVQPSIAATALAHWLKGYDAGLPSLLDLRWWESPDADERFLLDELGIVPTDELKPGVVDVGEVLSDTPSAGALKKGDRIVGLDGHLLDVDFPESSLRRMFFRRTVHTQPVLRLLRDDTMIDLTVSYAPDLANQSHTAFPPAEVVRNLLAIIKTLQSATFTVRTTSGRDYWAELSLRFAPARP